MKASQAKRQDLRIRSERWRTVDKLIPTALLPSGGDDAWLISAARARCRVLGMLVRYPGLTIVGARSLRDTGVRGFSASAAPR